MFNWLMDHVFDRARARAMREEWARFEESCRMVGGLNRRVRASFTDEEWKATEARCMAKLEGMEDGMEDHVRTPGRNL
jgi:hypothetical protein